MLLISKSIIFANYKKLELQASNVYEFLMIAVLSVYCCLSNSTCQRLKHFHKKTIIQGRVRKLFQLWK